MKAASTLIIAFLVSLLIVNLLQAQNPANFRLIYGNRDASPFTVVPGSTILLPVWGSTDPNPNSPDTVVSMTNLLASRDLYVDLRLGGYCVFCPDWDSACTFQNPQPNVPTVGYTNQTMISFGYLHDPYMSCFFYTGGDTILIGYFRLQVSDEPSYYGQTVNTFVEGGFTLWGMQDGVRGVNPIKSFSQLYFTPCFYTCGDANGDSLFDGRDIAYSVNNLKGIGPEPPYSCPCPGNGAPKLSADSNGDCVFNGIDVSYSVNYLKGIGQAPRRCPRC